MEEYKTVEQAAELLNVTTGTVTTWLKGGKFPNAHKVGRAWRIPLSDIEAILSGKAEGNKNKIESKEEGKEMSESEKEIQELELTNRRLKAELENTKVMSEITLLKAHIDNLEEFAEKWPEYKKNLDDLAAKEKEVSDKDRQVTLKVKACQNKEAELKKHDELIEKQVELLSYWANILKNDSEVIGDIYLRLCDSCKRYKFPEITATNFKLPEDFYLTTLPAEAIVSENLSGLFKEDSEEDGSEEEETDFA